MVGYNRDGQPVHRQSPVEVAYEGPGSNFVDRVTPKLLNYSLCLHQTIYILRAKAAYTAFRAS